MLRHVRRATACRCRRIAAICPLDFLFPNANIACMEHDAHTHVDTSDSCLISTAALREVHRFAQPQHLCWKRATRVDVGRRAALDAGAWAHRAPERHPPWSYPIFCCRTGRSSRPRPSPTSCAPPRPSRSCDGWAFLYDPSGEVECPRGCRARRLVAADDRVRVGTRRSSRPTRWSVPSRLHGVALGRAPLDRARRRAALDPAPCRRAGGALHAGRPPLDRSPQRGRRPRDPRLGRRGGRPATDLLAGIVATDSREQSGIWSTASGVLAAYRTEGALASTRMPPLDFEAFCDGPNTLYICSTGRRQRQFAPLVVAIVGDVRDAAYARARDERRRAARPSWRSTRWPTSPPSPTSRPWSARAPGRGSWSSPACRTSPRPAAAGARRPTGSSRSSARPSSCAASPTPRRCATSARWPGDHEVRHHHGQPVGRPLGPHPPLDVGRRRRARPACPSTPWPRALPAARSVLGPHKEVQEVVADPGARALAVARARAARARRSTRGDAPRPRPLSQRPRPSSTVDGLAAPEPGPRQPRACRVDADVVGEARPSAATARLAARLRPERLRRRGPAPSGPGRRRSPPAASDPHARDRPGSTGRGPSARRMVAGRHDGTGAGGAAPPPRRARAGTQWPTRRSRERGRDAVARRGRRTPPPRRGGGRRRAAVSEMRPAKRCSSNSAVRRRPGRRPRRARARSRPPGRGPAAPTPRPARRTSAGGSLAGARGGPGDAAAPRRARTRSRACGGGCPPPARRTRRAARARRRRSRPAARARPTQRTPSADDKPARRCAS